MPSRSHRGFSLVEIMIVVVIIGLMAGVVTFATARYLEKSKQTKAKSDIATLAGAVESFYMERGDYPDNRQGLAVLAPDFVKVVPNDPWGEPYVYVVPGEVQPFDIMSYGADGREGGEGRDADVRFETMHEDVEAR
ncbi:MAG: type II secretion system major pseudopilin GspG [Planctomycetota bacterium]